MPSALSNKFFSFRQYIKHLLLSKRSGHGVHSPFVYRLCEELFYNRADFYEFAELQILRRELLQNKSRLQISDLGAGSRHFNQSQRQVCDIARFGISDDKKNRLLFRLIHYFNTNVTLELGSSLGLNAIYMAFANKKGQIYSLEGDPALAAFARSFTSANGPGNIQIIEGDFDSTLPGLLEKLKTVDHAFVDGNHRYESTLHYFELLLKHSHSNSILVFDDIYWSKDMNKAWTEIEKRPEVKLSIDLFHLGIVFFKEEIVTKTSYRIWY